MERLIPVPTSLEDLRIMSFANYYAGRRVLVTGETGFKGSWLAFWLHRLGAKVYGVALEPDTEPSNFHVLDLPADIEHVTADICDSNVVRQIVRQVKPEVVFHLAAQALVRRSYRMPLETIQTNLLGTANLLEGIRHAGYSGESPCSVVAVTSDKCYENRETCYGYREEDPMGGHDIYSASKGAMELLVSSWRRSFFPVDRWAEHGVSLMSARAGNVFGGGDWSEDRIMVDCAKSLARCETIAVRNPDAIRPWQHVLEPLSGYLQLAAEAAMARGGRPELVSAFNFGPGVDSERPVRDLVEAVVRHWGAGQWQCFSEERAPHEATYLKLATDRAWHVLRWRPTWDFETSVCQTATWYKQAYADHFQVQSMRSLTALQIDQYTANAARKGWSWAKGC